MVRFPLLQFFSGLVILILALFLQFLLASAGLHMNLVLAILIAFAFIFDFWELLLFDAGAIFILNWEPALSLTLITFALVPFIAFAFRRLVRTELWIGSFVSIMIGFLIFYLVAAPTLFIPNIVNFMIDLVIGLIVGELALFALN